MDGETRTRRSLRVLKTRGSAHDTRVREVEITAGGLHPSLAANLNGDEFVRDPATPLAGTDRVLILSADVGG